MGLLDKWSRMVHDKFWWKFFVGFVGNIRVYWGGFVLWGGSSYKVKGHDMRKILDCLQPGDVLLRTYNHYLGSIFVPGYWSHAALYVGDDSVIHMLGHGVCKEDILTFMRCDGIAVLRCSRKPELVIPAIAKAKAYLEAGTDYDYGFIRGDTSLYCSEMIYHCYDKDKEIKFGKYILPDDLLCPLFDLIYSTGRDKEKIIDIIKEDDTPFTLAEKKDEQVTEKSEKQDGNNT